MTEDLVVVGLDIGTTKVCTVVGSLNRDDGTIEVIGVATTPSHDGVKRGAIVDINQMTDSIASAINEVERSSEVIIQSVYVGIAGSHILSMNAKGIVAIKNPNNEITSEDIDRAVDQAKTSVIIPSHHSIIHILPIEFVVDEQKDIKNPLGMVGSRLEAHVHIVTGAVTARQNIVKCCEMADLQLDEVVLQQYAASMAVLSEDEKKLGVVLLDIGGGTTDIILFQNGQVVHSSSIDMGGQLVTNDIAIGLKTSTHIAEELKINQGLAFAAMADPEEEIEVPMAGGDRIAVYTARDLAEIIEPRMEEILNSVKAKIQEVVELQLIPAGVVLTGGTSLMRGCTELAEEILGLPVRVGMPIGTSGLSEKVMSPRFSTALGLVRYGALNGHSAPRRQKTYIGGMFDRIKSVLTKFFTDSTK